MFTAIKLGDSLDKQKGNRTLTIKFVDGAQEFEQDFKFPITESVENIMAFIKADLDKKNTVVVPIPDGPLVFNGAVDVPQDIDPELAAKIAYNDEREKLKLLKEDVALGLASEAEYAAAAAKFAADNPVNLLSVVSVSK